jgi:hypothetical protein
MLIEMQRRGVVPNLIVFANTSAELPETYENNARFSEWLHDHGMPTIKNVSDGRTTLEKEVLEAHTMPSLVFGFRSCSDKYKIRPINRYLAEWLPAKEAWAAGGKVVKLVGFDASEGHRIKDYGDKKYLVEYPLVKWGWGRKQCTEIVRSAGLRPGKSACFFCPASPKRDVLRLSKTHPELFARAVEMERNATAATTAKGLGRHWSWEALVKADAQQMKLFDDLPDMVPCGCYDGGSDEANVSRQRPLPAETDSENHNQRASG